MSHLCGKANVSMTSLTERFETSTLSQVCITFIFLSFTFKSFTTFETLPTFKVII